MADKHYIELLEDMKALHIKKNAGYAGVDNPDAWANFREADDFGVSPLRGCLVRMSDKYIRVKNLLKNPANEQVGENIKDTLKDLAAYALIAVCLLEEEESQSKVERAKSALDRLDIPFVDVNPVIYSKTVNTEDFHGKQLQVEPE